VKRIGKTDGGEILVALSVTDIINLSTGCQAIGELFDVIEVDVPNTVPTSADPLGLHPGQHKLVVDHVALTPATRTSYPKMTVTGHVDKPARDRTPLPPGTTKACAHCGKTFEPPRKDSRFCSKSCGMKAWRADKKMSKPTRAPRTKKTIKYPPKTCANCKKTFDPVRHDQTCCSRACRAKTPRTTYPKYDAAKAKAERLAMIKTLASRKISTFKPTADSIRLEDTAEFKQAQREASAE